MDFGRVDGIAHVMAFAVGYIGDKAFRFAQFGTDDFYNINIPENPDGRIRITRQGKFRYGDAHEKAGAELVSIPLGPRLYEPVPGGEYDIDAVMEGIISITPVTLERTNLEVYGKLCDLAAE